MDIPREKKNPASPVTGAITRGTGQAAPPRHTPTPGGKDGDFDIKDDVFTLPGITLVPRADRGLPEALHPPPPEAKEPGNRTSKKVPLEKRTGGPAPKFRRLITRPETSYAAHAALDQVTAESPASMDAIDRGSMQIGKIHRTAPPDYRPNRLFRVLDGIYTHSPLRWLDFVDRTGARFLAALLLFLTVGGVVAWRYFSSFAERTGTSAGGTETPALSSRERAGRGEESVKQFLAAQTIEARLPFVIDPDRAAEKMRLYYDTMQGLNPQTVAWEVGEPVAGEYGVWLPFTFTDAAGRRVTVVMGEDENGCRIDWENFVAFGELPWQEFCTARVATPKSLRVRLRRVENYEGIFTKDDWQSYQIEHRSGGPVLTGYASRSGRHGQILANLIKDGSWQAAHVYLRFDPAATGEVVIIDDLIRTRWQDEMTTWTNP